MIDLDYMVIKFIFRSKKSMKIGEMAKLLNLPHTTLGSCIKRLEKEKYVIYKRYNMVLLSETGKDLAIELVRHAQLLEVLLYKELGLSAEEAHNESEKLHLLFSCNTINKICEKFKHPKTCPCGELILNSSGCYCDKNYLD